MFLNIYMGGEPCGELEIHTDGLLTVFNADCRLEGDGIFRVYAFSGDSQLYLGILEPSAGVWKLRRSFTRDALRRADYEGCDKVICLREGEKLPEDSWDQVKDASFFVEDNELKEEVKDQRGVLTRVEKGVRLLAFPAEGTEPFNLEPLFIFAEIKEIKGKPYAVFRFNTEGDPAIP